MTRVLGILALALAVGGCASWSLFSHPGAPVLAKADELVEARDYSAALAKYEEYLKTYPDGPAVGRARASRDVVEDILTARAALARLRDETVAGEKQLERLRHELEAREGEISRLGTELTQRDGELRRLRQEVTARQDEVARLTAEAAQLRADLERLKQIDIRLERKGK